MASRLTTLQSERHTLTQDLAALQAQIGPLLDSESVSDDQVRTIRSQITDKRAAIVAKEQQIAETEALIAEQAQAPSVTTHRQTLSATPGFEQDPRCGFQSSGDFARSVYHFQLAGRNGTQSSLPASLRERMAFISGQTNRFLQQEAAELRAHGFSAAADTPLHQEGYTEDGLMVPTEFRQQIWKPAYEQDDMLSLFRPEPSSSVVIDFLADETTPWGASGIKAYWVAEGAQLTASKAATQPRSVRMHKAGVFVSATNEILQDAPLLTNRINEQAPQAMGWLIVEGYWRGDGIGKPLGFEAASYPGRVSIAKETNQKAASIYTENVLKMSARILEGPGSRLMWLNHRSTIPQIATLKIGNEPSWTNQNQGLREAPNGMLLGAPIKFTQHAKTLGTVGDTTLIDFAGYAAFVHSSGTRFDASMHLYFDFDKFAFRWIARVAGMPYLSAPVSPADGADTMSHFIQLATRA